MSAIGHVAGCDSPIDHAACCASAAQMAASAVAQVAAAVPNTLEAVLLAVGPPPPGFGASQLIQPAAVPVVPLAAPPVVPLVAALAAAPPVAAPAAAPPAAAPAAVPVAAPPAAPLVAAPLVAAPPAAAPPAAGVVPNGAALLVVQGTEQANLLARQQQELNDLTVQQHAAQVRLLETQREAQLIGLGPLNARCTDMGLVQREAQRRAFRTLADKNADIEAELARRLMAVRHEVSRAQTALRGGKEAGLGEDAIGLLELALENEQRMEGALRTNLVKAMNKSRMEQLGLLQQNHAEQVALIEAQWCEKNASIALVLQ